MLTSKGTPIKHAPLIFHLLDAVQLPKEVAVMHCPAHIGTATAIQRGNASADQAAKKAAEEGDIICMLPLVHRTELPSVPEYVDEDGNLITKCTAKRQEDEWWLTDYQRVVLPKALVPYVMKELHESSHFSQHARLELFDKFFIGKGASSCVKQTPLSCLTCAKHNPKQHHNVPQAHLPYRPGPEQVWHIDFIELPRKSWYFYLGVAIDGFSNWPIAWPCQICKAREVATHLLKDLIPNFGIPL